MYRLFFRLTAVAGALAFSSNAASQAPKIEASEQQQPEPASAPSLRIAEPQSDQSNFIGDRIKFQYSTFVVRLDMTDKALHRGNVTDLKRGDACASAGTVLRGIGVITIDGKVLPAFKVTEVPGKSKSDSDKADKAKPAPPDSAPDTSRQVETTPNGIVGECTDDSKRVKVGEIVVIDLSLIKAMPPFRVGLTYGTLLVPFKYRLKGDKDFAGSTSVGGYVGYRQDDAVRGLGLQAVVFLGAANVEVPQTIDGVATKQNLTGLSYGVAWLFTVKDSFRMGFVLGADRVNASAKWKDNGKAWLAFSLGYAFSN